MKVIDAALVLGATMRLTRLVVAEDLGRWLIKQPAENWVDRGLQPGQPSAWTAGGEPLTIRAKIVSGLDCPFCVGTWIGFGVLGATLATDHAGAIGRAWRFVLSGLVLNEVAAHLGAKLGDTAE